MFPTNLIGCLSVRYVFCKCFQTNGNLQLRILTVCFLRTLAAACLYGVLLRNNLKQLFPVTCVSMRYVFAYIPMRYVFRRCFQTNRYLRSHACRYGMFSAAVYVPDDSQKQRFSSQYGQEKCLCDTTANNCVPKVGVSQYKNWLATGAGLHNPARGQGVKLPCASHGVSALTTIKGRSVAARGSQEPNAGKRRIKPHTSDSAANNRVPSIKKYRHLVLLSKQDARGAGYSTLPGDF